MQATLIENNGTGRMAYDSLVLDNPKAFSALNSKLALKIVKSLAESPASAIDISRKLKIHEQKVYYHTRKLEKAGIIYTISQERRHGMIAKIYSVVSPVIATKLYDKGVEVKENAPSHLSGEIDRFFTPFIEGGKLNAKIIVADPYSHGKYLEEGKESQHIIDLCIMFGNLLTTLEFPYYKLDTEVKEFDLKNNLILLGNAWTNTIIDKVNGNLPIFFDSEKRAIISKFTNKLYKDPNIGAIVKCDNPFEKNKKLLLITSIRTRGIEACNIALTQYLNNLVSKQTDTVVKIIEGFDKDGDKKIDFIRFLE